MLKNNKHMSSSSFLPLLEHTKKFFKTLGYKPNLAVKETNNLVGLFNVVDDGYANDKKIKNNEDTDHHLKQLPSSVLTPLEKSWTSTRCLSKIPDFFDILNYSEDDRINGDISAIFRPTSYEQNPENTKHQERDIISGTFLRLIGTEFLEGGKDKNSKNYLYIEMGEKVVFTTEIYSDGSVKDTRFNIEPVDKLEELTVVLRREKQGLDRAENRGISKYENGAVVQEDLVKWYKAKIKLRKYRLGIVEQDRLVLRRVPGMGTEGLITSEIDEDLYQNEVFEMDVSLVLRYKNQVLVDDFKEIVPSYIHMLQLDNYWHVQEVWKIPNLVEQYSLIKVSDYQQFLQGTVVKNDSEREKNQKDYNSLNKALSRGLVIDEKALLPMQKYIDQEYAMIPMCKTFIEAIFYSELDLNEKMNLLWDTLSFFENCNKNEVQLVTSVETETVSYFARSLAEKCLPSVPDSAVENLTDLLFYGSVPTVIKALFLIEEKIIDITDFMVGCLNHVHIGSGKKELDFSKLQLIDAIKEYVKQTDKAVYNVEEGYLFLQIFTNLGVQNLTIAIKHKMQFHNLRGVFKTQTRRIAVQNTKKRVNRELFERQIPQFGLFSHVYQINDETKSKEKYRVNSYSQVNGDWFESVILHDEDDVVELYEEYPEWDRNLFNRVLGESEYLCFLLIRPWDLFIIDTDYVILL